MAKSRDEAQPSPHTPEEPVGRRALLRRAATVAAAGIGGIAATEMLTAGPARADAGDPLVMSPGNDAGTSQTTLTSGTTAGASLEIANTGDIANVRLVPVDVAATYGAKGGTGDPHGVMQGGELINLTEPVKDPVTGITSDADTLYWMAGDNSAKDLSNLTVVLTTATGTVFAPVHPTRLLDTRISAGRKHVLNPSALDSSGRLLGGRTLNLDLSDFVYFAYAIHFNLTAVSPTAGGYLEVWPGGTKPTVSNLNYSKAINIANSGISPLSQTLSISIYASSTTHVLLDVQAYTLPDFSFLIGNGVTSQAIPQSAQMKARAAAAKIAK